MMRRDFRLRLLAAAVLPTVLFAIVLTSVWSGWFQSEMEDSLYRRTEAVARQLSTAAEFHLFSRDITALGVLANSVDAADTDITAVSIYDAAGNVLVYSGHRAGGNSMGRETAWSTDAERHVSRLEVPIKAESLVIDDLSGADSQAAAPVPAAIVGYVVLEVSRDSLLQKRNDILGVGVLSTLAVILAGSLLAVLLGRSVTAPIGRIIATVNRIGEGDLQARIEPDPNCVLYPLEQGINRMAEHVELNQEELQHRIDMATVELRAQKLQAEREARLDSLTGLSNRRAFVEQGELEIMRASRYSGTLACVIIDLDHFKRINDSHGHAIGDQVLVAFADILRHCMREVDFLGRIGGEEFAILMPGTDCAEAERAAERIRLAVESMRVEAAGELLRCTASFGVTEFAQGDNDLHALLARADRALYRAKDSGRNRVETQLG